MTFNTVSDTSHKDFDTVGISCVQFAAGFSATGYLSEHHARALESTRQVASRNDLDCMLEVPQIADLDVYLGVPRLRPDEDHLLADDLRLYLTLLSDGTAKLKVFGEIEDLCAHPTDRLVARVQRMLGSFFPDGYKDQLRYASLCAYFQCSASPSFWVEDVITEYTNRNEDLLWGVPTRVRYGLEGEDLLLSLANETAEYHILKDEEPNDYYPALCDEVFGCGTYRDDLLVYSVGFGYRFHPRYHSPLKVTDLPDAARMLVNKVVGKSHKTGQFRIATEESRDLEASMRPDDPLWEEIRAHLHEAVRKQG
jgi:hypothetical protein